MIPGFPTNCELCKAEYRNIEHPMRPGVIIQRQCDCRIASVHFGNGNMAVIHSPPDELKIKYDNERERHIHGYDAGQIVDGTVSLDPVTGRFVLVDEDGVGYDSQEVLKQLVGKQVRLTLIALESMEQMQEMLESVQANRPS